MATPPPGYETVIAEGWSIVQDKQPSSETVQRWNIREVVTASRVQNVASVVEQLLPQIKAQAEQGYSRSELILIPCNEQNARNGNFVGLDKERPPLIVQFEGNQNTSAFWSQDQVLLELKDQLSASLDVPDWAQPMQAMPTLQQRSGRSASWFGRSAKEPLMSPAVDKPKSPPVTIKVAWDDLHTRSENEYGLYETKRAGAVFITINVS